MDFNILINAEKFFNAEICKTYLEKFDSLEITHFELRNLKNLKQAFIDDFSLTIILYNYILTILSHVPEIV